MIRVFTKTSLFFLVAVLFVFLLFSGIGHAITPQVTPLELNRWYDIQTSASPVDLKTASAMLKQQSGGKPFISLYRFTLKPGAKYTFLSEFGADYQTGSACLRGLNPLAPNNNYSYPPDTAPLVFCRHKDFPGGNIKGHVFGRHASFTVSSKSKHNYAWLVFSSSKPNVTMKVKMISPALPDNEVKERGFYQKRPNRPTYYSWGQVHKKPLYLGYVKGEKPFSKATPVAADSPYSHDTVDTGITGEWELFGKDGKPYARMDLSGSGAQVKGRVHYFKGGSAAVSGTINGDRVNLVFTYDNEKILENWFPKKVCSQIVGIKSYFDIDLSPGSDLHNAVFHSFSAHWDGAYNVTRTYQLGDPDAENYIKASKRKVKKIGGSTTQARISGPKNLSGWIKHIKSGKSFTVIFDKSAERFDDSRYTGNWKTDPMGTLKGGESYQVYYRNKKFTCRGYNQGKRQIFSSTNGGINPKDSLISLWGRTYSFDGKGRVWDQDYGIVGHLSTGPVIQVEESEGMGG